MSERNNTMESDDDNLFYMAFNNNTAPYTFVYTYNISTGRIAIDNSGVKILSAIDLSSNSIKFNKSRYNRSKHNNIKC